MIGAIKRYTGTAAEIGNFSLVGVPVGSTFFESDTGQLKILSAAGTLVNAPSESVTLSGSNLAEQKTQADADNNVITFTENISTIEIYHAEPTWQTFTVNGIAITVPAGGYRTPVGGVAAKTVTIPANVNCIVGRLV